MHVSKEEYIKAQRLKVADIATKVLEGKLSILLAARQIVQLRYEIGLNADDNDLLTFVVIASECDSLHSKRGAVATKMLPHPWSNHKK